MHCVQLHVVHAHWFLYVKCDLFILAIFDLCIVTFANAKFSEQ